MIERQVILLISVMTGKIPKIYKKYLHVL